MSSHTCPLCGLRYPARPLLDLHIREDHAQRDDKPAAPAPGPRPPPGPRRRSRPADRRGAAPAAGPRPPGAP